MKSFPSKEDAEFFILLGTVKDKHKLRLSCFTEIYYEELEVNYSKVFEPNLLVVEVGFSEDMDIYVVHLNDIQLKNSLKQREEMGISPLNSIRYYTVATKDLLNFVQNTKIEDYHFTDTRETCIKTLQALMVENN